jgi:hypothetical protein
MKEEEEEELEKEESYSDISEDYEDIALVKEEDDNLPKKVPKSVSLAGVEEELAMLQRSARRSVKVRFRLEIYDILIEESYAVHWRFFRRDQVSYFEIVLQIAKNYRFKTISHRLLL